MPSVLYIIEVAVAFGVVILVHELGHFVAAKAFGVWVRRFAIGFGPPILKRQKGETEYSLRTIPLGGFIEPMGEHPDSEGGDDPRALWRRPAWKRAVVFAAGVGMNLVLAVLLFTAASLIGLETVSPVVGDVEPLTPAHEAGIEAGDRIVGINGRPIDSFEDIQSIVLGQDAGTPFNVTVERTGEDGRTKRLTFDEVRSHRGPGDPYARLGIRPAMEPVISEMIPSSPVDQAGLRPGDRIVAVGDRPVARWREIAEALEGAGEGPVTLTIRREGQPQRLTVRPSEIRRTEIGMAPPIRAGAVEPDSPAHQAGIRPGDRIVRLNEIAWPSVEELQETVRAAGDGGEVRLVVRRDGEEKTLTARAAVYGEQDYARIGIVMGPALGPPLRVGHVEPDGPAADAGIRPGDLIVSLTAGDDDRVTPGTWEDVYTVFGKAAGKPVTVEVRRGEQESIATVTARREPMERFRLLGSSPGLALYEPLPRIYNPLTAAGRGFRRTWTWLKRVYTNFLQLIKGQVGGESFGGPVLIAKASYDIASRGLGTFLDFWGILSVCIAVINFLPLPPFDGGHVVFVIVEKLKGGPVSMKVRTWIWGAGWAAVLALFILITWQDIARLQWW